MEIYRHKDTDNAFGIYTSERPGKCNFLEIGDEAYFEEGVLNLLIDRYYIKIHSAVNDEFTSKGMKDLAARVVDLFGKKAGSPPALALFPSENKVTNSERYINKNFLGYDFLGKAFTCKYNEGGQTFTLFIISESDASECREALSAYFAQLKLTDSPEEGKTYLLPDKYNGTVGAVWQDKYVYGFFNMPEDKQLQDTYFSYFKLRML